MIPLSIMALFNNNNNNITIEIKTNFQSLYQP